MEFLARKHHAFIEALGQSNPTQAVHLRSCFEVLALSAAIDQDCARRLATHDLSEGRFVLLFLLNRAERANPGQGLQPHVLADRAGVTRATITGLLDGLERDALVRRIPSKTDRRSITIALTKKGATLAESLFADHANWMAGLLNGLSARERETLSQLLSKIWRNTDVGRVLAEKKKPAASAPVEPEPAEPAPVVEREKPAPRPVAKKEDPALEPEPDPVPEQQFSLFAL